MKNRPHTTNRHLLPLATAIASLLASHAAQAAALTWNLTTGGTWNTSTANWTGGGTTFTDGSVDAVTFDKTNGGTINIAANMSPLSTTVSAISGTYIFSGGPIDSGTLSKSGGGTLTLSNANSFSGVTLSAGVLNINDAGALGSGTFTISGGTIDNTTGSSITLSTNNPLALNGSFTFSRTKALNLGTGAVTLGATVAISGNGATTVPLTIGGNIASTANGFTLTKGAMVILNGTNNYTGKTSLTNNGGGLNVLRANDGVGLPTASNLLIQVGVFETGIDLVRAGGTGAGQMQLISAGTTAGTLNGFSANGGPVNIAFGTLASPTALTWGSGDFQPHTQGGLLLNNSTANNTLDFRNAVNLGSSVRSVTVKATNAAAIATMSGALSGTGGLNKSGAGTLVLSGTNTYSGVTTVDQGTLKFAKMNSLYNNVDTNWTPAKINVKSAATLALNVDSAGANGFTDLKLNTLLTNISVANTAVEGLQSGAILGFDTSTATGATFTQGNAIANSTGSSTFHGAIGVTKLGAGTMIFDKVNTYTGATTVTGGTLAVTGSGSINSTSGITIASGAHFKYNSTTTPLSAPITNNGGTISGTGTIGVAVAMDSTSDIIAPGNSPGIQPYGTSQTWSSFTYEWETNNFTGTTAGTDFDQIAITGSLSLTGAAPGSYILDLISLNALNGAGNVPNFSEVNRSWDILTATGGITGFDASYWTIDHSTGLNTFTSSPTWGGTWLLSLNDTAGTDSLVLTYTAAVPEPGAALIGGLGMLALLRRRRN